MNKNKLLKSVLIVAGLVGGLYGLISIVFELNRRAPDIVPKVFIGIGVLYIIYVLLYMVYDMLETYDKSKGS